jgi:hypothetical protein
VSLRVEETSIRTITVTAGQTQGGGGITAATLSAGSRISVGVQAGSGVTAGWTDVVVTLGGALSGL